MNTPYNVPLSQVPALAIRAGVRDFFAPLRAALSWLKSQAVAEATESALKEKLQHQQDLLQQIRTQLQETQIRLVKLEQQHLARSTPKTSPREKKVFVSLSSGGNRSELAEHFAWAHTSKVAHTIKLFQSGLYGGDTYHYLPHAFQKPEDASEEETQQMPLAFHIEWEDKSFK